jgi:hypothetical protein
MSGRSINLNGEIDRRELTVFVDIPRYAGDPLQLLAADYTYIFDYVDKTTTYLPRIQYKINSQNCECIRQIGKHTYTFRIVQRSLFHCSFHAPNATKNPVEKSVGAFHLRLDVINKLIFRPFIVHPVTGVGYEFYNFHDIDRNTTGYFTTAHPNPPMNELGNYMSKNVTVNNHILVNQIAASTYDLLVNQILNPMIQSRLPAGTMIPIPSLSLPGVAVRTCADMKANPDPKPSWFGGGNDRPNSTCERKTSTKKKIVCAKHSIFTPNDVL